MSVEATSTIETPGRPSVNFLDTVLRADEQRQREFGTGDNARGSGLAGPFDMLGFIGEITSELGQKQLNILNGVSDFISPTLASPGEQQTSINDGVSAETIDGNQPETPEMTVSENGTQATYEEQLLMHFLEIESLPTIFGPVSMEWKYARPALLSQSLDSIPLLNAVYCYADVHKAIMEGKRWRLAPTYHRRASLGIQECTLGDVDESTLKRIFAAVFLLMLSEVRCPILFDSTCLKRVAGFFPRLMPSRGLISALCISTAPTIPQSNKVMDRTGPPDSVVGFLAGRQGINCRPRWRSPCRIRPTFGA